MQARQFVIFEQNAESGFSFPGTIDEYTTPPGLKTLNSVLEGRGGEWFNFQAPPRIYLGWDDDPEEDDPTQSTPLPPSSSLATCFCFFELCDFESWESWSLVPRGKASSGTTSPLKSSSGIVSSPPKKLFDCKKNYSLNSLLFIRVSVLPSLPALLLSPPDTKQITLPFSHVSPSLSPLKQNRNVQDWFFLIWVKRFSMLVPLAQGFERQREPHMPSSSLFIYFWICK